MAAFTNYLVNYNTYFRGKLRNSVRKRSCFCCFAAVDVPVHRESHWKCLQNSFKNHFKKMVLIKKHHSSWAEAGARATSHHCGGNQYQCVLGACWTAEPSTDAFWVISERACVKSTNPIRDSYESSEKYGQICLISLLSWKRRLLSIISIEVLSFNALKL